MPRALLVSLLVMLVLPVTAAATTYTVTTTADSNDPTCTPALCSLRDAINHSVSGDKVVVPAGTYTLSLGVLAIGASHDLTIVGAGASSTTVDANQTSGVFTVAAQDNVTMSGLTITGGKRTGSSVQGGGINSSGNLTLNGVVVIRNKVESPSGGSPGGGGIEVAAGNLTLINSQIRDNVARCDTGGGVPQGAGINDDAGGLVSISNSQITLNTASIGGGGGTAEGGGIRDGSPGTMMISGSQINQNSAQTGGSGGVAEGGGLQSAGGGVVTITSSTLNANSVSSPDSGAGEGGAIDFLGGSLAIANTTLSNNVASASGAAPGAEGGGIWADGSTTLDSSTVSGNTANAASSGGAVGGGLALRGSTSISNATITGNSATTTGTGTSHGGGFFAGTTQPVTLLNSTIDANSAPSGSGGSFGGNFFKGTSTNPSFENTILSAGTATTGPNCAGSGAGTITSQGHNLESGSDCGFTASGDHQTTDPLLGPLQDNGGPTQTQAVQPGSAIIDSGNNADCPSTDQRGVGRPQGPVCEIGALEVELPQVTTGAASAISQTTATLNGTVNPNTLKPAPASYHFDYGTTTAYGSSTPTASGSGAVSASLSNLTPNTTYHFRIVASNADGGSASGADQTFTTAATPKPPPPPAKPKITGLGETHRVFVVGNSITPLQKATPDNRAPVTSNAAIHLHPLGTVFSFTLNQAAKVKIKILARKPGRLLRRKCKPPSRRLRHRPRCTRSIPVATLTRGGIVGLDLVSFTGRLPHKVLAPGRYQAVFTASNANGTSGPQAIGFTIVKR